MKNVFFLFAVLAALACEEEVSKGSITFGGGDVEKHKPQAVSKTNSLPVYMHYMPWFVAKDGINNNWGIHWTMSSSSPDVIGEDEQRDIASHYYPLIGPYSTNDPLVIDYHLLLMKYAGIDGILINWYGVEGSNGDINELLEHSEAIIDRTDESGMEFGVVLEDRFSTGKEDAMANVSYLSDNYYVNDQYLRYDGNPLTLIFGPITINGAANWNEILGVSSENEVFMPLWYNNSAGSAASGQYAWVYRDAASGLQNFYSNRDAEDITGGAAYPGFHDYYEEGGWEESALNWTIDVSAGTMKTTLDLAKEYQTKLDFLQLVTWNDFGEGTMIEPTVEFGFSFLEEVQQFTGVEYGVEELEMIHELYLKRQAYQSSEDTETIKKLDQVFYNLVALKVDDARSLLDTVD